jgi:hypothetical protein
MSRAYHAGPGTRRAPRALLRDPGMQWWLKMLLWASVALVLFDIAHTISVKIWPKKWQVFAVYSILVLALLVAAFRSKAIRRGHLNIAVGIPGNLGQPVPLTNDFLQFEFETNLIFIPPTRASGVVMVPVPEGSPNVRLAFFAQNDSHIAAQLVSVTVSIQTNVPCEFDSGWRESAAILPWQRVVGHSIDNVEPGDFGATPMIVFKYSAEVSSVILISFKGKDIKPRVCAFRMLIVHTALTPTPEPFVVLHSINESADRTLKWHFIQQTQSVGSVTIWKGVGD